MNTSSISIASTVESESIIIIQRGKVRMDEAHERRYLRALEEYYEQGKRKGRWSDRLAFHSQLPLKLQLQWRAAHDVSLQHDPRQSPLQQLPQKLPEANPPLSFSPYEQLARIEHRRIDRSEAWLQCLRRRQLLDEAEQYLQKGVEHYCKISNEGMNSSSQYASHAYQGSRQSSEVSSIRRTDPAQLSKGKKPRKKIFEPYVRRFQPLQNKQSGLEEISQQNHEEMIKQPKQIESKKE